MHDDFFELGGNSLLATQVVTRIRRVINFDLLLRDFFDRPTIDEIVLFILEELYSGQ